MGDKIGNFSFLLQFKKTTLNKHLPFLTKRIKLLEGQPDQQKYWTGVYDRITNDNLKLTDEQINKLDQQLTGLKLRLENSTASADQRNAQEEKLQSPVRFPCNRQLEQKRAHSRDDQSPTLSSSRDPRLQKLGTPAESFGSSSRNSSYDRFDSEEQKGYRPRSRSRSGYSRNRSKSRPPNHSQEPEYHDHPRDSREKRRSNPPTNRDQKGYRPRFRSRNRSRSRSPNQYQERNYNERPRDSKERSRKTLEQYSRDYSSRDRSQSRLGNSSQDIRSSRNFSEHRETRSPQNELNRERPPYEKKFEHRTVKDRSEFHKGPERKSHPFHPGTHFKPYQLQDRHEQRSRDPRAFNENHKFPPGGLKGGPNFYQPNHNAHPERNFGVQRQKSVGPSVCNNLKRAASQTSFAGIRRRRMSIGPTTFDNLQRQDIRSPTREQTVVIPARMRQRRKSVCASSFENFRDNSTTSEFRDSGNSYNIQSVEQAKGFSRARSSVRDTPKSSCSGESSNRQNFTEKQDSNDLGIPKDLMKYLEESLSSEKFTQFQQLISKKPSDSDNRKLEATDDSDSHPESNRVSRRDSWNKTQHNTIKKISEIETKPEKSGEQSSLGIISSKVDSRIQGKSHDEKQVSKKEKEPIYKTLQRKMDEENQESRKTQVEKDEKIYKAAKSSIAKFKIPKKSSTQNSEEDIKESSEEVSQSEDEKRDDLAPSVSRRPGPLSSKKPGPLLSKKPGPLSKTVAGSTYSKEPQSKNKVEKSKAVFESKQSKPGPHKEGQKTAFEPKGSKPGPYKEVTEPEHIEKDEVTSSAKTPKRKGRRVKELERLHESINSYHDSDSIVHAGGKRSCTLNRRNLADTDNNVNETDDGPIDQSVTETITKKYQLKTCIISCRRLNMKGKSVVIDNDFLKNNPELSLKLPEVSKAADQQQVIISNDSVVVPGPRADVSKEKVSVKNTVNFYDEDLSLPIEKSKQKQADAKSTEEKSPKKKSPNSRKRGNNCKWSRGIIQRKSKRSKTEVQNDNSDNDWEDVEIEKEPKRKTMKLKKLSKIWDSLSAPKKQEETEVDKKSPNLSYTDSQTETIFQCRLCSFDSIDPKIFLGHIKSVHVSTAWSKYCQKCDKIIDTAEDSLESEFNHMMTHLSAAGKSVDVALKPHLLKVKMLPGDKLSSSSPSSTPSTSSSSLNSSSVIRKVLPTPLSSIQSQQTVNPSHIGTPVSTTTVKIQPSTFVSFKLANGVLVNVPSNSATTLKKLLDDSQQVRNVSLKSVNPQASYTVVKHPTSEATVVSNAIMNTSTTGMTSAAQVSYTLKPVISQSPFVFRQTPSSSISTVITKPMLTSPLVAKVLPTRVIIKKPNYPTSKDATITSAFPQSVSSVNTNSTKIVVQPSTINTKAAGTQPSTSNFNRNSPKIAVSQVISCNTTKTSSSNASKILISNVRTCTQGPNKSSTTAIVSGSLKLLPTEIVQFPPKPISPNVSNDSSSLRPWLSSIDSKSQKIREAMLKSTKCLTALYKCMASTCAFYTSDASIFKKHLHLHNTFQKEDIRNTMSCAYCSVSLELIDDLVEHIKNAHGYDKFQCSYCFYRSYNDFHVSCHHANRFHANSLRKLISLNPLYPRKFSNELMEVKKNLSKNVPQFVCYICEQGFYISEHFQEHLISHQDQMWNCVKCRREGGKESMLRHICMCFPAYGLHQCVYCSFGCDDFAEIDLHILDKHSNKEAMFCKRTLAHTSQHKMRKDINLDSLLIHRIQKLDVCPLISIAVEDKLLINSANLEKLYHLDDFNDTSSGSDSSLAAKKKEEISSKPSTSGLQISSVMSLGDLMNNPNNSKFNIF